MQEEEKRPNDTELGHDKIHVANICNDLLLYDSGAKSRSSNGNVCKINVAPVGASHK